MDLKYTQAQREEWKNDVIAFCLLMGFAFFINRGITIKGLYMDDLYLWSCYGEQSFFQYVFPMGSTRFRFIYYLAAYLEFGLIGTHIELLVPINIVLNGLLAGTIYLMGRKLSRSYLMGFFCGVLFLLSRMSYYQIGQVYGLMETMALWAAIGILYLLYRYLNEEKGFLGAVALYFTVCFIHERYMVLLPLFFLVLILKKKKELKLWLYPLGTFLLVQLIRLIFIGTVAPAGTGGTDVADTFSLKTSLKYALSQAAYVFGINAGPEHLNGMSWQDSPRLIQVLVIAADVFLVLLVLLFLAEFFRNKKKRFSYVGNSLLFLGFIAGCIASSSVTIRVEMRWVYVSYAGALLYLCYLFGQMNWWQEKNFTFRRQIFCGLLFGGYVLLMFPVESFYRSQFPNLYLWPNQMRYNSLAEETYGKYGDAIFGKTIYIIGDSYEMSDFTAKTFFKVFDKERKAEGTQVIFIDSIREIGQVTGQMLILREEPKFNAFQDITEYVKRQKCDVEYGYYEDGWMDEQAKLRVMAGSTGVIRLELSYPGNLTGKEISQIYLNGQPAGEVKFTENIMNFELKTEPYQTVELEFSNNFYMHDALEQRGENRLAAIVNITAD